MEESTIEQSVKLTLARAHTRGVAVTACVINAEDFQDLCTEREARGARCNDDGSMTVLASGGPVRVYGEPPKVGRIVRDPAK
jgi:hypothetical protein